LAGLLRAGIDVARVNFSHGKEADHRRRVAQVRELAAQLDCDVGILADLQGPKIRIERFRDGKVELLDGRPFVLDASLGPDEGTVETVGITYKELPGDVRRDDVLLLNDGLIALAVDRVEGPRIHTIVVAGGELSNGKGINRQGGGLSAGALTDKDRAYIKTAAELGCDFGILRETDRVATCPVPVRVLAMPAAPAGDTMDDPLLPVIGARTRSLVRFLSVFVQQDETLLLSGPTGTGKSRLAEWCHARSLGLPHWPAPPRASAPNATARANGGCDGMGPLASITLPMVGGAPHRRP
jgi:hypothetical protein